MACVHTLYFIDEVYAFTGFAIAGILAAILCGFHIPSFPMALPVVLNVYMDSVDSG